MIRLAGVCLTALVLAGCTWGRGPLHIGTKGFDEQAILAHVLRGVAERQGRRAVLIECGDTFGCHEALRDGEVDLMVEYTGTAIALSGIEADDPDTAMARVQALYAEQGLRWFPPLGFDNAYAVVAPTARAAALGLESIEDLGVAFGGLRMAVPPAYVRRPGDGLFPLLRRYGLTLAAPPLLAADPTERYRALEAGSADVAIAYATDGALQGPRLRVLADPLGFFSAYQGAVVAREAVLRQDPGLTEALERLVGRIDTAAMRRLNARVQLEGARPRQVAEDLLYRLGLGRTPMAVGGRPELLLARSWRGRYATEAAEALRMTGRAFPGHTVRAETVADPAGALANGVARLAVMGAEEFFTRVDDRFQRDARIEAVAVLDTQLLHLVRRRGDDRGLAGRIGVPGPGEGGALPEGVLATAGRAPADQRPVPELLAAVANGTLDGVLVAAPVADAELAEGLARRPGLTLWPVPTPANPPPYLRVARLPAGSYPRQPAALDTLGAQVVLAAPAAPEGRATHLVGPAAALRTAGLPLNREELNALVAESGRDEVPDPVLPSPWSLQRQAAARTGVTAAAVDTVLNLLVWAFLGWLGHLLLRSEGPRRRG